MSKGAGGKEPFMLTQESTAAHARISELAKATSSHAALNNEFYRRWMAGPLSAGQVEIVARNFYERVRRTPDRIALAYLHMDDITARAETVEILSDEMGHGNPEKVHSVLLQRFFETLLSRMRDAPVTFGEVRADILGSTHKLIEEGNRLFASSIPQEACGALLAQEWHAYPQLVYLYEGARNYQSYFDIEEFHDICEYFYLHIGATEKEHKVHSLSTAARMCRNEADLTNLERGFTSYLDLLADNWADIGRAIETA
jgi:pyrroloquinoline quinone (PQQ) biosynthesis protein C